MIFSQRRKRFGNTVVTLIIETVRGCKSVGKRSRGQIGQIQCAIISDKDTSVRRQPRIWKVRIQIQRPDIYGICFTPKLHRGKRDFFACTSCTSLQAFALNILHIDASVALCADFKLMFLYCFYVGENRRENKIHALNSARAALIILQRNSKFRAIQRCYITFVKMQHVNSESFVTRQMSKSMSTKQKLL